jgi:uncharacterized protein YigE (DUF2233 family)
MTGGMYLNDGIPQGLYVENGPVEKPLNTLQKAYGDFYLHLMMFLVLKKMLNQSLRQVTTNNC